MRAVRWSLAALAFALAIMVVASAVNYVRIKGIARVVDASTGSTEPHFVAFPPVGARVSHEPLEAPRTASCNLASRLAPGSWGLGALSV